MVRVDKTPPTVTFGAPYPPPNAAGWHNGYVSFPFVASDALSGIASSTPPASPLVLMEDLSALVGLAIAFVAVALSAITGNGIWDAVGSILIGVLLMTVAGIIARDAHSLLIGERAVPEVEHEVRRITEATPGVRCVTQLLTMHLGPEFVLLAMKVAFEPAPLAELEETIDEIERRVRDEIPIMKKIFIEPDSKGDRRGVEPAPAS